MKIIELKSSNIKRLKAVELRLDESQNLVLITGKNGQGKTSILDSIWYALGGKKAAADKPIRNGEEKGEIEIDAGGYIIKRTFTDKGSYLQATNKDGVKYSNPQEFLDFITGNLSFDPLEFSRMDAKKQVAELIKIVGLDLTPIDEKIKSMTQERLMVGREMKAIGQTNEATVEAMKAVDQTPIDLNRLNTEYREAIDGKNRFANLHAHKSSLVEQIANLTAQLTALNAKLEEINSELAEAEKIAVPNPEEIKKKIDEANESIKKQIEAKRILDENNKYLCKKEEYEKLTGEIQSSNEEKASKLSKVKMPIDGLSWNEDAVLYNSIPFSQASAAEQLRVSMAIAMASNPKLKVILIRDGSLLDSDNLKVIEEMARDKDFQIWVEKVDDSGKLGIYIEEGEVKSINE